MLIHALPIFHVHGLFVALHGALINGSKMIWLSKFDPREVVETLPEATVFMGVPTLYVRLLAEPALTREACRNMRLFVAGSAPLLIETFREFEQRTGHTILERYGMSETAMLTSNPYRSEDGERRGGTVGFPLPGVGLRVRDGDGDLRTDGEIGGIEVSGPNVFQGYWRMPEKTREEFTDDGWFKTGDVGRIDERGYVQIVGRSKDLIISGGYNVYPAEIEGYLNDMPGVAESAVDRRAAFRLRRGGGGRRRRQGRRRPRPRRADRQLKAQHRQLQGAEAAVRRRRPAAQHDGQGAEEPAARSVQGLVRGVSCWGRADFFNTEERRTRRATEVMLIPGRSRCRMGVEKTSK